MNIPYTFNLHDHDDDNQWPEIGLVHLELDLTITLGNPYNYGEDADGKRGEQRQDIESVVLSNINYLTEEVPENLKDFISEWFSEYYTLEDWCALIEKNGGYEK